MNKIENELKWSIESNYLDGFFFNGKDECIRELDIDNATKKCFESIERHTIGFVEWLGDKRFNRNTWFDETNHCMDMVTTEELFNLYIETL